MPSNSSCLNCGAAKPLDRASDPYCETCQKATDEATKYAHENKLDVGTCRRQALAQCSRSTFGNRPSPKNPITRGDYWYKPPVDGPPLEGQ